MAAASTQPSDPEPGAALRAHLGQLPHQLTTIEREISTARGRAGASVDERREAVRLIALGRGDELAQTR